MRNPGKGIGHSWAYLPDLAETFAGLLAIEEQLRPFERVQFEGTWDADGSLLPQTIRQVLERDVPEAAFPVVANSAACADRRLSDRRARDRDLLASPGEPIRRSMGVRSISHCRQYAVPKIKR